MSLTLDQLAAAAGARIDRAQTFLDAINDAMDAYEINTPARQAAFLAQIGHESGGLKWVFEVWGPTAAQAGYEGRADLGNTHPGDGYRYRGRGLLQTTGRANYATLRDRLRYRLGASVPDFEESPDDVALSKWAALSACDFWLMKGLNEMADARAFERITKRINGGLNGQDDRVARYERAQAVLA